MNTVKVSSQQVRCFLDQECGSKELLKCSFVVCALVALFVQATLISATAQSRDADEPASPLLKSDSAFVWVPALIKTRNGKTVSNVDVSRLHLLDNGTPEKAIEINTAGLPISLIILMQTGGSAGKFISSYLDLPGLVGGLVGTSVHEITLVTFDSRIEEIWHFPTRADGVDYALTHQHSGDKGAAIKDAVAFGVRQLQGEPGRFRRIVLLLSQKRDVGSSTSSRALLEQLGISSTVVYSLTFADEKTTATPGYKMTETKSFNETLTRTDRELDDITAEEVAHLTGGNSFQFDDRNDFNSAMLETISNFRGQITLGFQPSHYEVGFHRIEIRSDSPKQRVTSRRAYWCPRPD